MISLESVGISQRQTPPPQIRSVHGWGAIMSTSQGDTGQKIVGSYTKARELLGMAFLLVDPAHLGNDLRQERRRP
jgi:hypothetical protein